MNKAHQSEMEGNEMSVLLKYYIQKVCAKIKPERWGEWLRMTGKLPETNNHPHHRSNDAGPAKIVQ
jgi:hypothetical protein